MGNNHGHFSSRLDIIMSSGKHLSSRLTQESYLKASAVKEKSQKEKDYGGDPCLFLSRVLWRELGFDGGEFKQLAVVVHGVLLESGFVGFDPELGKRVDRLDIADGWPWTMSAEFRFTYTLSEILQANQDDHGSELAVPPDQTLVLKYFRTRGWVNVSGLCSSIDFYKTTHTTLDVLSNLPAIGYLSGKSKFSKCKKKAYELWKTVKAQLALPLLIDLRKKAGLPDLPCHFMGLTKQLKLRILGFLPSKDVAKVGCVCRELNHLSRDGDLWKKFGDKFGSDWKQIFVGLLNLNPDDNDQAKAGQTRHTILYFWPPINWTET